MPRNSLLLTSSLIALVGGLSIGNAATTKNAPNVLLILTDDQGFGDLGLHGNPVLETPRMDALGRESVQLRNFYVSPLCAPTRASLLTGRYHLRTGVSGVTRRREVMRPGEVTLAELFQEGGYQTGCFGKWHNGAFHPETPNAQGFGEFLGFTYGHTTTYFDPILDHNGVPEQTRGYITDILTDAAIGFIRKKAAARESFFCYLAYNAPHTPALAPASVYQKYKDKGLTDHDAAIYAMIDVIDTNVGRLLDELRALDLEKETAVIFLSDNGPKGQRYNAGLKGEKGSNDEGGVRVPCFVRWPARWPDPALVETRLMHIDILPTLADICGLSTGDTLPLDGRSFLPLLDTPDVEWPGRFLHTFSIGTPEERATRGSVRGERWLGVKRDSAWELYDLINDPGQTSDVARLHPQELQTLSTAYEKTLAEASVGADDIAPIPVGHREAPTVLLEAPDAALVETAQHGIAYNFPAGYAHNWITHWTDTGSYPEWTVDVAEGGTYQVALWYCLQEENRGVRVSATLNGQSLTGQLNETFDPPVYKQPFLLPGEAEKYAAKPWKKETLGVVELHPGVQNVQVKLKTLAGPEGMELKAMELTQMPAQSR